MSYLSILEPGLFLPDAIAKETADLNKEVEEAVAGLPPIWEAGVAESRQATEDGQGLAGPLVVSKIATERTITGRNGEIGLRIFSPETTPKAVYFHIHGGGWVLGGNHHQDAQLEKMCRSTSVVVASVDYRLAPEHPYPAGLDDCEDALIWVIENASAEFGTERIAIGGESAGAHLAVGSMVRLRDRHDYRSIVCANLVYGIYDLNLTPSARNWGDRSLVLDTPSMHWFIKQYLPDGGDLYHPEISPMYADLSGLGPALFTVGTEDAILDDTLFMSARWAAAGNPTSIAVYPGGAHGFDFFPIPLAEQALSAMHGYIDSLL